VLSFDVAVFLTLHNLLEQLVAQFLFCKVEQTVLLVDPAHVNSLRVLTQRLSFDAALTNRKRQMPKEFQPSNCALFALLSASSASMSAIARAPSSSPIQIPEAERFSAVGLFFGQRVLACLVVISSDPHRFKRSSILCFVAFIMSLLKSWDKRAWSKSAFQISTAAVLAQCMDWFSMSDVHSNLAAA
jgi:hypothetical protein